MTGRHPHEGDALEREPERQVGARPDPLGRRAGDRGDDHRRARPGQHLHAGLQRPGAHGELQDLREQEDRPEHPEEHHEAHRVRGGERPRPEQLERDHRRGGAALPGHERRDERGARDDRREHERARPAVRVAADEARRRRRTGPRPTRATPGRSRRSAGPRLSRRVRAATGSSSEPERDVEPEDPLPGEAVDDEPAEQRPDGDAEAAHAGPHAQRQPAALGRVGGRQQRQRQRGDDRPAGALQRAGEDERAGRRGERGGGRGEREQREAAEEQPPASEPVAERGAGHAAAPRRSACRR